MRLKIFKNRQQAGRRLANEVARHRYSVARNWCAHAARTRHRCSGRGDAPEVVRNERLIRELGISEDEFIEEHSGSSRSSRHAASYGSQDAPAFP
jgi:hypothetical protein